MVSSTNMGVNAITEESLLSVGTEHGQKLELTDRRKRVSCCSLLSDVSPQPLYRSVNKTTILAFQD